MIWYRKAADQGYPNGLTSLGWMYVQGLGAPQDFAQALAWLHKAADQGNAAGQANLGWMYEHWPRRAAGLCAGGDLVSEGRRPRGQRRADRPRLDVRAWPRRPQDFAQAVIWYRKAADQESAAAQNNLGLMYENGRGVPQDYIRAHMWYNLAASGASDRRTREEAVKARDAVATKMTSVQIAEAQRLAREWKPK